MKFYKVHAAKYKDSKVLFIPEQFDEIGPDVFSQTNFEYIILSRKVKMIKNHAFSDLKKCKVYLPKTIEEIEPLAFEDIDERNEFYCIKDSVAYKACIENQLKVNEDVESCINEAEAIRDSEEKKKTQNQEFKPKNKANDNATIEVQQKQSRLEENVSELYRLNGKENKQSPKQEIKQETKKSSQQKKPIQETKAKVEDIQKPDEELFFEKFGLPPIVDMYSPMGKDWKKQISQMESSDIIDNYDSNEYCDEYRYYCYEELKNRYNNNTLDLKPTIQEVVTETIVVKDNYEDNNTNEELYDEQFDENDITYLLGMPPKCDKTSGFNSVWKRDIHELSTREVLDRYDSEDWNDEYRYLCYKELTTRNDLEALILDE